MALRYAASAAFAVALGLNCISAFAEPVKIRVSYIVPGTNFFSIFQAKAGLMKNLGKTYTLEASRYQATPLMISAMAVGELDVGMLNFAESWRGKCRHGRPAGLRR